ncbi:MAG TPA: AAA family ATPase [Candidatus Faecalibacterium intestinigallinarum]|uniref:AAA family ATPase n=1 Tax=Candidatus Faecalibacterium intestinigallinarum TaxID=2838581 RepID=A0A9D1QAG6_9FIRM|nr:AAA family ATPase [Candidatus Faecalibacterium intestinigallinarum]
MGYNDDWESLMNSVFGPGGRMRTGGAPAAKDAKTGPKPAAKAGAKPAKPDSPDLNKALLEQQKALDKLLKKQNEALRAQDASTKQALEDSRRLLRDMEDDGLLARGTADTPAEHLGSFEGLAAEVKQVVLGQDAYVDALVRAMRRPFVLGTEGQKARNVILLWGPAGTGRHFALEETARRMAARGLLQSDQTARMDLALYADPGAEKLFLQDLYAALHGPGEMVLFDHYESCCPAFLKTLADLAVKGAAPLASRYLVNREGILVDAGAALAAGAVSRITPRGKYLIFFSHKGRAEMAGLLGADFAAALGDACETKPFTRESLQALAARLLNELARRCARQLQLTLSAGEDVRDYVAARHTGKEGAAALAGCCERIFRALSEYCLRQDSFQPGTAALAVREGTLCFSIDGSAPAPLADLLPAAWDGGVEAVRRELDALVGLDEVKQYVFGLADNVQVQKRRAAAGLKTASLSMHMIFTGNPGTGKTTIARLVARYLKAIGALRGGQLVEVSRGDLVGRYTGHTAPLTNSVIESALGGVLFIDEAYSLYRGEQDSFGLEAIDTLVKGMEDHRDDLVVILAGYTREMQQFLTANSGLASRFPNQIEFPDYTADQLLDITVSLAAARGYRLDDSCTFPLLGYYQRRQAADSRTAGNGRLARNTLEKAIYNQSRRLVAEPDAPLDLILAGDLEWEE